MPSLNNFVNLLKFYYLQAYVVREIIGKSSGLAITTFLMYCVTIQFYFRLHYRGTKYSQLSFLGMSYITNAFRKVVQIVGDRKCNYDLLFKFYTPDSNIWYNSVKID